MGSNGVKSSGPSGRSIAFAMIGWAGLAACLTMVFWGMRAVMAIGGSCAEGGPYVISQSCPEGSTPALFLGIFGGVGFALLASLGGFGVGGFWAATPLLAWAALFGSLGWNFLDYGVFSPPEDEVVWSWAIPGVLFVLMALGPLMGLLWVMRGSGPARGSGGSGRPDGSRPPGGAPQVEVLDGPGQPPRGRTGAGAPAENRQELAAISAGFGAAIGAAMAETPLDPVARDARLGMPVTGAERGAAVAAGSGAASGPGFTEGTQALLDRLERLADMRDRGLLGLDEY
ncbi:MAG TPA: hypothetical protein VES19_09405, partial [Candidatus Limnocylindrales bacterium]|nr:hypothetical protein [Candidatus Limnocylindrales bacterium]